MDRPLRTQVAPGPGVAIVPATLAHAGDLATRMRGADARECWMGARLSAFQALQAGFLESKPNALTALLDGVPAAMFGVTPCEIPGRGSIWLLGSDACATHGLTLTRGARLWIPWLSQGWHELGNYVDAHNLVHIRWLDALGFDLIREIPEFGPDRVPFKEYVLCVSRSSAPP